jgi:hypothetical protein
VLAALPLLISILALLYENVLDAIEYGLPALVLYRIGRAIRYVLAAELSNGESGPAGSRRRSPRAFFALAGHGESRQGNGGLVARAFPRYARAFHDVLELAVRKIAKAGRERLGLRLDRAAFQVERHGFAVCAHAVVKRHFVLLVKALHDLAADGLPSLSAVLSSALKWTAAREFAGAPQRPEYRRTRGRRGVRRHPCRVPVLALRGSLPAVSAP